LRYECYHEKWLGWIGCALELQLCGDGFKPWLGQNKLSFLPILVLAWMWKGKGNPSRKSSQWELKTVHYDSLNGNYPSQLTIFVLAKLTLVKVQLKSQIRSERRVNWELELFCSLRGDTERKWRVCCKGETN